MDEASNREEEYYRRLKIWTYITLADIYFLAFFIMVIPFSGFDSMIINIGIGTGVFSLLGLFIAYVHLLLASGFWYSSTAQLKSKSLLLLGMVFLMSVGFLYILLLQYFFMHDLLMAHPLFLIFLLFMSVAGPMLYFISKWAAKWIVRRELKDGSTEHRYITRMITLELDAGRAKNIVDRALENMGLQYAPETEDSKKNGFYSSYALESGLHIRIEKISAAKSSVHISRVQENDTLEKQIEEEILRHLSTSQP